MPVHRMTRTDAATAASLLDAFNREFDTPTPGVDALTARLAVLAGRDDVVVLLAGEHDGVAVVSFRQSVWADGTIALLDELYVRPALRGRGLGSELLSAASDTARAGGSEELEINVDGEDHDARRFYERHGFTNIEPGASEPMYFYYRRLV
ncbi:GNAT family N-acetyltransferase [Herbiconiux sp. SYSU D00978]|uniref:GNAT family N-acetyltransferase n=1 Tax=Herbiconiux sp. SYSU D00978 TaxID=2812562 RepID=UPI001A96BEBE|nr:GNAT family N-acetyltransferase [Herbiconiux sp. SYSU D00978]